MSLEVSAIKEVIVDRFEKITSYIPENCKNFLIQRKIIQGLALSILASMATAYTFGLAPLATAALYGGIHFVVLNASVEYLRRHYDLKGVIAGCLLFTAAATTPAILHTIFHATIGISASIPLAIASTLFGLVIRTTLCDKHS